MAKMAVSSTAVGPKAAAFQIGTDVAEEKTFASDMSTPMSEGKLFSKMQSLLETIDCHRRNNDFISFNVPTTLLQNMKQLYSNNPIALPNVMRNYNQFTNRASTPFQIIYNAAMYEKRNSEYWTEKPSVYWLDVLSWFIDTFEIGLKGKDRLQNLMHKYRTIDGATHKVLQLISAVINTHGSECIPALYSADKDSMFYKSPKRVFPSQSTLDFYVYNSLPILDLQFEVNSRFVLDPIITYVLARYQSKPMINEYRNAMRSILHSFVSGDASITELIALYCIDITAFQRSFNGPLRLDFVPRTAVSNLMQSLGKSHNSLYRKLVSDNEYAFEMFATENMFIETISVDEIKRLYPIMRTDAKRIAFLDKLVSIRGHTFIPSVFRPDTAANGYHILDKTAYASNSYHRSNSVYNGIFPSPQLWQWFAENSVRLCAFDSPHINEVNPLLMFAIMHYQHIQTTVLCERLSESLNYVSKALSIDFLDDLHSVIAAYLYDLEYINFAFNPASDKPLSMPNIIAKCIEMFLNNTKIPEFTSDELLQWYDAIFAHPIFISNFLYPNPTQSDVTNKLLSHILMGKVRNYRAYQFKIIEKILTLCEEWNKSENKLSISDKFAFVFNIDFSDNRNAPHELLRKMCENGRFQLLNILLRNEIGTKPDSDNIVSHLWSFKPESYSFNCESFFQCLIDYRQLSVNNVTQLLRYNIAHLVKPQIFIRYLRKSICSGNAIVVRALYDLIQSNAAPFNVSNADESNFRKTLIDCFSDDKSRKRYHISGKSLIVDVSKSMNVDLCETVLNHWSELIPIRIDDTTVNGYNCFAIVAMTQINGKDTHESDDIATQMAQLFLTFGQSKNQSFDNVMRRDRLFEKNALDWAHESQRVRLAQFLETHFGSQLKSDK